MKLLGNFVLSIRSQAPLCFKGTWRRRAFSYLSDVEKPSALLKLNLNPQPRQGSLKKPRMRADLARFVREGPRFPSSTRTRTLVGRAVRCAVLERAWYWKERGKQRERYIATRTLYRNKNAVSQRERYIATRTQQDRSCTRARALWFARARIERERERAKRTDRVTRRAQQKVLGEVFEM